MKYLCVILMFNCLNASADGAPPLQIELIEDQESVLHLQPGRELRVLAPLGLAAQKLERQRRGVVAYYQGGHQVRHGELDPARAYGALIFAPATVDPRLADGASWIILAANLAADAHDVVYTLGAEDNGPLIGIYFRKASIREAETSIFGGKVQIEPIGPEA